MTSDQVCGDVTISGQGFYTISGNTQRGKRWVRARVQGADSYAVAFCESTPYALAIADGALASHLVVEVNGRRYVGNNRVEG